MATRRDYLISKNLAKPGRGRLSREGLAEIERARNAGVVFDDDQNTAMEAVQVDQPAIRVALVSPPVVRNIKAVTGYTAEGAKVSTGMCMLCKYHVSRCPCSQGITASSIVSRWDKDSEQYGKPIAIPV